MVRISATSRKRLLRLFETSERVIGLKLCIHDNYNRGHFPAQWRQHRNKACLTHKQDPTSHCRDYGGYEVHREASGHLHGFIHTCPYGFSEIAIPINQEGLQVGLLFAGTCWLSSSPPPHKDLIIPPSKHWLAERVPLVKAIADQISVTFSDRDKDFPNDRKNALLEFLQQTINEKISIADMAKHLHLSPSRTAHIVKEIFNTTPSHLIRRIKLEEACRLLSSTDLSISEVSLHTGFDDPNYFSRIFRSMMRTTPREYRQTHRRAV